MQGCYFHTKVSLWLLISTLFIRQYFAIPESISNSLFSFNALYPGKGIEFYFSVSTFLWLILYTHSCVTYQICYLYPAALVLFVQLYFVDQVPLKWRIVVGYTTFALCLLSVPFIQAVITDNTLSFVLTLGSLVVVGK